ncbi:3-hydroxymethyl-3-methylglutaryl-CoA lyase [Nesidiocoris tenuis]|uniref:hydroxymethylglutaryl-CoA lyase n=1 Tax=Nesidiocoris tenuis TaxID=355587 RepID=A0ABN7ALT4_9HEMI|nr:3-hydroxymethyl-3-methylglutaryl-CoA lyase [Nesidiocoris tenuis]
MIVHRVLRSSMLRKHAICQKPFLYRLLKQESGPRNWPNTVKVVEVGPRDGLQNEPTNVPTDVKVDLISRLVDAGIKEIETTSFVSAKWVPQMGDNREVMKTLTRAPGVNYVALVPNLKGLESAETVQTETIALFLAASESFSRKNTNCSIEESKERARAVLERARAVGMRVRGYVSCICGCPYEGKIEPQKVAQIAKFLYEEGCYEVSLGDTIGTGTPASIAAVLAEVTKYVPADKLALHCHNTYGQALPNIFMGLQMGVNVFDSSVGGLGGCPYAKGASGNVATEDLVYMLHGMGIETGVDLNKIVSTAHFICSTLGKQPQSNVSKALPRL